MIKYKCEMYGKTLIEVNPSYTSQRCSKCGHTEKDNRLSQSEFKCKKCNHTENADINAAKNIELLALEMYKKSLAEQRIKLINKLKAIVQSLIS
jgi:transposase